MTVQEEEKAHECIKDLMGKRGPFRSVMEFVVVAQRIAQERDELLRVLKALANIQNGHEHFPEVKAADALIARLDRSPIPARPPLPPIKRLQPGEPGTFSKE